MRKTKLSIIMMAVSFLVLAVSAVPATAQGNGWRDINPTAYISPPANPPLNSVYMLSGTEGWAVGDSRPTTNQTTALPAIVHYDGFTWNLVPAPKFPDFPYTQSAYNLTSVTFGTPQHPISRNDGWAVGYNGTLPPATTSTSKPVIITLSPSFGPAGTVVTVSGSGFNPADAGPSTCPGTAPAIITSSPTNIINTAITSACTFTAGGQFTGSFTILTTAAVDVYTIQVTALPSTGDFGTATFTVTGPAYLTSTALHWDGASWRVQDAGLSGPDAGPLWSAFMVSSTDVWAVGQTVAGTKGTFWHWSGVSGLGGAWSEVQPPVANILYSVSMVSSTEGWAVGQGGVIFHYFGGTWTTFATPVSTTLRSVYMLSATEGWASGEGGTILHYSGGTWTGPVSPGTTSNNLLSIFMVSSTEGWASGSHGALVHYFGGAWTALPINLVPTAPVSYFNFTSIYFNSATDGWGVGSAGVILHYDGTNFGTVTSPTINNFTSISFGPPLTGPVNPNDGWAVGNASATPTFEPTVYHWNGFMWTKGISIGTLNNLNSVFMIDTGDVWTVGGGLHATASCVSLPCPVILHYNGGYWSTLTPPPGSYVLKSVFMVSSSEGWAVGELAGAPPTGIILHYTVTGGVGTWAIYPAPTSPSTPAPLNSVFMLGADEGWAVGDNATILHYTVTSGVGSWNVVAVSGTPALSKDANLTSIFMLSPTSGWAVGGIQAQSSFSAGPVIISWDGTKWSPVATPTIPGGTSPIGRPSAFLKSVFCTGPNDCWTGGLPAKLVVTLFHWDGISWNQVTTSPAILGQNLAPASGGVVYPPIISSIYLTSPGSGWAIGSSRDLLPLQTSDLSAMLEMGGGLFTTTATTSTSTVVSTVTTSTTSLTSSIISTFTSINNTTSTFMTTITSSVTGGVGIPGFPIESILAGIFVGLMTITVLKRRRSRRTNGY